MSFFSSGKSKTKSYVFKPQADKLRGIYDRAEALSQTGVPVQQTAGVNRGLAAGISGLQENLLGDYGREVLQSRGLTDTAASASGAAVTDPRALASSGERATAARFSRFDPRALAPYIDNDILQGQIDASSRDIVRNLREQDLPGIDSAFSGGAGGASSSRRGVAQGIAARGAADRISDVSAKIRGDAYNRALGIQTGREAQDVDRAQQASLANQQMYNALLDRGAQLREQGLGRQISGSGSALQQLLARVRGGTDLLTESAEQKIRGGGLQRSLEQEQLDEQYRRQYQPFQSLNWLSGIIGDPTVLTRSVKRDAGLGQDLVKSGLKAFTLGA